MRSTSAYQTQKTPPGPPVWLLPIIEAMQAIQRDISPILRTQVYTHWTLISRVHATIAWPTYSHSLAFEQFA